MSTRAEHEEILATIAQSYDAGDYEYLPPEQLGVLERLLSPDAIRANPEPETTQLR